MDAQTGCIKYMKINEYIEPILARLAYQLFQAWICHCHLHPLQAANCCRNSRHVVDEDDLMWFKH